MPLHNGKGKATLNHNITEMVQAYKQSGKIGNTSPRNLSHAYQIASAAAHRKQRSRRGS